MQSNPFKRYSVPDTFFANRRGYVLLMVMALLVILVTALSMLATKSLRVSHQAANAAVRLQHRWGMASLKQAVLPYGDQIFIAYEKANQRRRGETSPNMLADSVVLGEQRFDLALGDESSKLNLNTVYRDSGLEGVTNAIQKSVGPNAVLALAPRPAVGPAKAKRSEPKFFGGASNSLGGEAVIQDVAGTNFTGETIDEPAFRSWGEVFDLSKLATGPKGGSLNFEFMRSLTLWGNGQININRTKDEAVIEAMQLAVPSVTAKSLLKTIRSGTETDLQALVEQKIELAADRRAVLGLISTSSFNFSLFIDVQSPRGGGRRLFVAEQTFNGQVISEFVFH